MTRRATWLFAALEAVLLLAVPLLAWVGFRVVLDTTEGEAVDPELDAGEPGFEAFLEPTPVALVIGVNDESALDWLTVIALGGPAEQGGAVLFIPPATVVDDDDLGEVTLAAAWADDGESALTRLVGDLLGAGFTEAVTVDPDRVAELLAPVSPLSLTLSEDIGSFDAGEVALDGAEFAELLALKATGESDLSRLARYELLWRAWMVAVAASTDPDVVPGERASGMGRYARGLAAGPVTYDVVPVTPVDGPEVGDEVFEPDLDAVADLVNERVPFPVADLPGGRPRVRVLDAVGVDGLALRVARDAVRAGGQVMVVGNADRFGAATSRVVFFDAPLSAEATQLAEALGVIEVERQEGPNPNDLVDITVVVGEDLAGAYGLPSG